MLNQRHGFVYAIQCETPIMGQVAVYVGSWQGWCIIERFNQHVEGYNTRKNVGSKFTQKFKPERLIHVEMVPRRDLFKKEDELSLEFFKKIPNSLYFVRGGSFVSMTEDCHTPARIKHWFPKPLLKDCLEGKYGQPEPDRF